jgi:hypothetical protein
LTIGAQSNQGFITNNGYFNGANWIYTTSSIAAQYYQDNAGKHQWLNAPSGTAGNAISFTQAMTLDASGNLGIGTTSPSSTGLTVFKANGGGLAVQNTATGTGNTAGFQFFGGSGGDGYIWNYSNSFIAFATNNTERMRITSGGEVYIAGTTDQGAYNLQCNGTGVWGAGAYVNGSDRNLKDNITPLGSCLDVVAALKPVTYQYKEEYSKDQSVQPGFIAQDLQDAMAGKEYLEGIVQAGPNHLNVAYQNLIPILTKALQEQQALIQDLTTRLTALEGN